ncbi:MAG: hypothetical protein ACQESR_26160 [Planctomycetota bacterium]
MLELDENGFEDVEHLGDILGRMLDRVTVMERATAVCCRILRTGAER